jgi:hypothetical protein
VVATRYHEKDTRDGTPGRILVISGTDGTGRPYRSELMVFRENRHHMKAINAVYWSNASVIERTGPSQKRSEGRSETNTGPAPSRTTKR